MKKELKKMAKNEFERDFFKPMNNSVLEKTMENVRKHREIKLATIKQKKNFLLSEQNYHSINFFTEILVATELLKKNKYS